jgi:hypothetical protein
VVRSNADGASCGLEVSVGKRIGLFLSREGDVWVSGLCSQVGANELLAAAGSGRPPVVDDNDAGGGRKWSPVAVGTGLAAAVALAILFFRRRGG